MIGDPRIKSKFVERKQFPAILFKVESDDSDDAGAKKNVSPFANTTILFTRPAQNLASDSVELPAGHIVEFLVGFENKGESDFIVEALDASFRYPMDFSYHIQNFSAIAYQKTVKPTQVSLVNFYFLIQKPEAFKKKSN